MKPAPEHAERLLRILDGQPLSGPEAPLTADERIWLERQRDLRKALHAAYPEARQGLEAEAFQYALERRLRRPILRRVPSLWSSLRLRTRLALATA